MKIYHKFWRILKKLQMFDKQKYLDRKKQNDSRDVIPACIVAVSVVVVFPFIILLSIFFTIFRRFEKNILILKENHMKTI